MNATALGMKRQEHMTKMRAAGRMKNLSGRRGNNPGGPGGSGAPSGPGMP